MWALVEQLCLPVTNTLALQLGAVVNVEQKLEKIVKKKPEPATGKRR